MKIVVIVVAALLLLLVAFAFFFLKISIYRKVLGRQESAYRKKVQAEIPRALAWFDDLREKKLLEDHYLTNRDGLRLHAYYIPCENAKGNALLVHGYSGCAIQTVPQAQMYHEKFRYNVVMVSLPAHAFSEGEVINMGWKERFDVIDWVKEVDQHFGNGTLPMVLQGMSMGGACVMMAAEEGLPVCVKGVVEDSGFASAFSELSHEINTKMHLPTFPFLHAANWLCKLKEGWSFKEASSIKTLGEVTTPLLIIHGTADTRVPISEARKIYAAKKENVEMWEVDGGNHICAIRQFPEKYEEKISNFLQGKMG